MNGVDGILSAERCPQPQALLKVDFSQPTGMQKQSICLYGERNASSERALRNEVESARRTGSDSLELLEFPELRPHPCIVFHARVHIQVQSFNLQTVHSSGFARLNLTLPDSEEGHFCKRASALRRVGTVHCQAWLC